MNARYPMNIQPVCVFAGVFLVSLLEVHSARAGEIRFASPFAISDVTSPVTVAAGEFNGDSRLDLVTAGGTGLIELFLQDPATRTRWTKSSLAVGASTYMVRAADLDGDGYDDILAADPATTAYLIRNDRGAFQGPRALSQARASRWIMVGDWNKDGRLDIATANFSLNSVSVFLGDGNGGLAFLKDYSIVQPHSGESLDYDGDGDLDLIVGHGTEGVLPFEGRGDGSFLQRNPVSGFPPCGRFVFTADWNNDGKGDLLLTCQDTTPQGLISKAVAGISRGDGSYEQTLGLATQGIATAGAADLNGDLQQDFALVSEGSRTLSVHRGKGDGRFLQQIPFGPTGDLPSFVAAPDLDADGRFDVVTADTGSSALTVFWGRAGEQFLEAGKVTIGSGTASAVADLDGDGAGDFFFPSSGSASVDIFMGPGFRSSAVPSLTTPTELAYKQLVVVDLNADDVPDLAGSNLAGSILLVTLLDRSGKVLKSQSLPAGLLSSPLSAGRLDGNETVDLAGLRIATSEVAIFLNQDGAKFVEALPVPTLERPRALVLGDVDRDGFVDMIVSASAVLAVHYGKGDGSFTEFVEAGRSEAPRSFLELAMGDVSGDTLPDLIAATSAAPEVFVLYGRGNRAFEKPATVKLSSGPRSLFIADVNRDGFLDITTANSNQTVSFIFNRGLDGLDPPFNFGGDLPQPLDHLVGDLNQDGVPDLALFTAGTAYVFDGVPSDAPTGPFRRGDADENGKTEITDAIALLGYLFLGSERPCEDASDADDDGHLNLTDALVVLKWLFQAGVEPPRPGPLLCGEDPTPDELGACSLGCR